MMTVSNPSAKEVRSRPPQTDRVAHTTRASDRMPIRTASLWENDVSALALSRRLVRCSSPCSRMSGWLFGPTRTTCGMTRLPSLLYTPLCTSRLTISSIAALDGAHTNTFFGCDPSLIFDMLMTRSVC